MIAIKKGRAGLLVHVAVKCKKCGAVVIVHTDEKNFDSSKIICSKCKEGK
jgi:formylmethanofuran dehydrogenase subunit E